MNIEQLFQGLYEFEKETLRLQERRVQLFEKILKRSPQRSDLDHVAIKSAMSHLHIASTSNTEIINDTNDKNRNDFKKNGEAQHDVNFDKPEKSNMDNEDLSGKSKQSQNEVEEINTNLNSNDSIYNNPTQPVEDVVMELDSNSIPIRMPNTATTNEMNNDPNSFKKNRDAHNDINHDKPEASNMDNEDLSGKSKHHQNEAEEIKSSLDSNDSIYNKPTQTVEDVVMELDSNSMPNTATTNETNNDPNSFKKNRDAQNDINFDKPEATNMDNEDLSGKSKHPQNEAEEINKSTKPVEDVVMELDSNSTPTHLEPTETQKNVKSIRCCVNIRSNRDHDNDKVKKVRLSSKAFQSIEKVKETEEKVKEVSKRTRSRCKGYSERDNTKDLSEDPKRLQKPMDKINPSPDSDDSIYTKSTQRIENITTDLGNPEPNSGKRSNSRSELECDNARSIGDKSNKKFVHFKTGPNINNRTTQATEIQYPNFTHIEPTIEVSEENGKSCDASTSGLIHNYSNDNAENIFSSTLISKSPINAWSKSRKRYFNKDDDDTMQMSEINKNSEVETSHSNKEPHEIENLESNTSNMRKYGKIRKPNNRKRRTDKIPYDSSYRYNGNTKSLLEELRRELHLPDYTSQDQRKHQMMEEKNKCKCVKSVASLVPNETESDEDLSKMFANQERCNKEVDSYKPNRRHFVSEKIQMEQKTKKGSVVDVSKQYKNIADRKPIKRNHNNLANSEDVNKRSLIHTAGSVIAKNSNNPIERTKGSELSQNILVDSENIDELPIIRAIESGTAKSSNNSIKKNKSDELNKLHSDGEIVIERALIHTTECEINNNDFNKSNEIDLPSKVPRKIRQQPTKKIDWNAIESSSENDNNMSKR